MTPIRRTVKINHRKLCGKNGTYSPQAISCNLIPRLTVYRSMARKLKIGLAALTFAVASWAVLSVAIMKVATSSFASMKQEAARK